MVPEQNRSLVETAAVGDVPVYVVASRDKFAAAPVASRLATSPLFEPTALANVTGVVTDDGLLEPSMARQVCAALERDAPTHLLAILDRAAADGDLPRR
jgi:translation initiation factor 2B subunit (eIF-2B alpha/beta/delta family)